MKKSVFITIVVLLSAALYAQLSIDFSTAPIPGGSKADGTVLYTFSPTYSMRFEADYLSTTDVEYPMLVWDNTEGAMVPFGDADTSSLYAHRVSEWDLNLYFFEWGTRIGDQVSLKLLAALNVTNVTDTENGHFSLGEYQTYVNERRITFIDPKVGASAGFTAGLFGIDWRIAYVPWFYYIFDQTMTIDPLAGSEGTPNTYKGNGTIYLDNQLSMNLLDWVAVDFHHEYQRMGFRELEPTLNDTADAYILVPGATNQYEVITVGGRVSVLLPIDRFTGGRGSLTIGVEREDVTTYTNLNSGDAAYERDPDSKQVEQGDYRLSLGFKF